MSLKKSHNFIDLTNQKFGRLTVLHFFEIKKGTTYWLCRCNCGKEKIVNGSHLRRGNIKSCGCLQREVSSKNAKQRQFVPNKRLYGIWKGMKERCYNQESISYYNYGKRGIKVCDEWKNNFMSFYNWAIANGYREDLTIDRINIDKNYEPNNCRWITWKEQCNNKRNNIIIEYNGEKNTVAYFIKKYNLGEFAIYKRLKSGWDVKKAIETPIKKRISNTGEFGISLLKNRNKYALYLKNKHIGNFNTLEEAVNKREEILNGVKS